MARISSAEQGRQRFSVLLGPGPQMGASGVLRHRDEVASKQINSISIIRITRQLTGPRCLWVNPLRRRCADRNHPDPACAWGTIFVPEARMLRQLAGVL